MRLINADRLEAAMYHEAFETTTDLQKWDSGCWIRYKMFENVIDQQPTVEAIPIQWLDSYCTDCTIDLVDNDAEAIKKLVNDWRKEHGKD